MNHRHLLALLLTLVLLVFAPAMRGAAGAPAPQQPEEEPNDTFYESNLIYPDVRRHGRIDPAGDVDVYTIILFTEATLNIDVRLPANSPLAPVVELYDHNFNLVAEAECPREGRCLVYTPTEDTHLYLVITDRDGRGGLAYEYSFTVVTQTQAGDPFEPNDFLSEATPYTLGQMLAAELTPEGDIDLFVFTLARSHDLLLWTEMWGTSLLDAEGNVVPASEGTSSTQSWTALEPGVYYLRLTNSNGPYTFSLSAAQRPVYVSFTGGGRIGGVGYAPGDVLRYTPIDGQWQMFFRAADHGLRGNMVGFSLDEEYEALYMTFATTQDAPGGGRLTPYDVLRYEPANPEWGSDEAWNLVFLGRPVGLSTNSERIDALDVLRWTGPDYGNEVDLYLSTGGQAQVPFGAGKLVFRANDLVRFYGQQENGQMSGDFFGYLSGQLNGFGAANVTGLGYSPEGWYLSFDRPVRLGDLALARGDIALCRHDGWPWTPCETITRAFSAATAGVGARRIDAIDVGALETP